MKSVAPRIAGFLVALLAGPAVAATLEIEILDRDGQPVPDVAVYVEDPRLASRPAATSAVMDQYAKQFVPHILVVQKGTSVEFPNSDEIAHHVYSFSYPNQFKLPIYKGDAYPPVDFTDTGVVVLGCNIHDNMLGYIVVVDTPVFAKTDASGRAQLSGDWSDAATLAVWSPRIRDALEPVAVAALGDDETRTVTLRLDKRLRAPHESQKSALHWEHY